MKQNKLKQILPPMTKPKVQLSNNRRLPQLRKQEELDAQEKTSAHLNLTSDHQPTNSH